MGVGFAPSERPSNCHASPGGMRSLTPDRSAGVAAFLFGFKPTCLGPKKVGPRTLTLVCSSACFLNCAPSSLDQKRLRWLASRNRYADVRSDHAGICLEKSCG